MRNFAVFLYWWYMDHFGRSQFYSISFFPHDISAPSCKTNMQVCSACGAFRQKKPHYTGVSRKPKLKSKNTPLLQILWFQLHQKNHSIQQIVQVALNFTTVRVSWFCSILLFFNIQYYFIMFPQMDWKWCPTVAQCFTPKFSYMLRFSFDFDLGKQDFLIYLPTYRSPNAFRITVNEDM